VDAIGEEEYRRALGEPIVVAGGRRQAARMIRSEWNRAGGDRP